MTETELLDIVRRLRREGCSPKEIARSLGVPKASVSLLVRRVAEEATADAREPALVGCWVNPGWSNELIVDGHPGWPRGTPAAPSVGLATVVVAREHRRTRVSACCYLVDTHCLGVKETIGPRVMEREELSFFNRDVFAASHSDPLAVPVELAQHLVLGAVEYARGLGFEPAPDFSKCAGHLGSWSGPSAIRFGRHGKPMYVAGPFDDPNRIMRTLVRSVGKGNFDFLIDMPLLI